MTGRRASRPLPSNPFERVVECPWGPLCVVVVARDEARLRTPLPVGFRSLRIVASGTLRRTPDGWSLSDFEAAANAGGRTLEGVVGRDLADVFRGAILDAAVEHLRTNERLLVEADLVAVYRVRKARLAEVEAIRREIERRRRKIDALAARNEVEFAALAAREAAIRAELDAMPRASGSGLATGAREVHHDVVPT